MRRYIAYVGLIVLLAPIEAVLPRLPLLHGIHLLLLLPIVFHLALDATTTEGLLLSYLAGFVEDATVSYTTGLASFSFVALFIVGRLVLVAFRADGPIFEAVFAFVLAAAFYALAFELRHVFEPNATSLTGLWWSPYLSACIATAVVAPFIMALTRRIDRLQVKSPGAL